MSHQLALILCLVLGTFGGAVSLAFMALFSQISVFGRSIEIARQQKKGFGWWYFLGGLLADLQLWKETKGFRWLFVVGAFSLLGCWLIYHFYLAQT
jgi:cytochrome c-type biogenesis protein CcmE